MIYKVMILAKGGLSLISQSQMPLPLSFATVLKNV